MGVPVVMKMVKITQDEQFTGWNDLFQPQEEISAGLADVKLVCQDGYVACNKIVLAQWSGLVNQAMESSVAKGIHGLDMTIILPHVQVHVLKMLLACSTSGETFVGQDELDEVLDLMTQLDCKASYTVESAWFQDQQDHEDSGVDAGSSVVNMHDLEESEMHDKDKLEDFETVDLIDDEGDIGGAKNKARSKKLTKKGRCGSKKPKKNKSTLETRVIKGIIGRRAKKGSMQCRLCPKTISKSHASEYFRHMATHYRKELMQDHQDLITNFKLNEKKNPVYSCGLCPKETNFVNMAVFLNHLAGYPHLKILKYLPREELLEHIDRRKIKAGGILQKKIQAILG